MYPERIDTFLHCLDALYAPVLDRLQRYDSPQECGLWNQTLLSDFQNNGRFSDDAGRLHDAAVSAYFGGYPPTQDGFDILNVAVRPGRTLTIHFRIYFFTQSLGHSVSPAVYRLSQDPVSPGIHVAEYGCGLRDRNG